MENDDEDIYANIYDLEDTEDTPKVEDLQELINSLSIENRKLKDVVAELKKNYELVNRNYYCLLNTAQLEIKRKDRYLLELQGCPAGPNPPNTSSLTKNIHPASNKTIEEVEKFVEKSSLLHDQIAGHSIVRENSKDVISCLQNDGKEQISVRICSTENDQKSVNLTNKTENEEKRSKGTERKSRFSYDHVTVQSKVTENSTNHFITNLQNDVKERVSGSISSSTTENNPKSVTLINKTEKEDKRSKGTERKSRFSYDQVTVQSKVTENPTKHSSNNLKNDVKERISGSISSSTTENNPKSVTLINKTEKKENSILTLPQNLMDDKSSNENRTNDEKCDKMRKSTECSGKKSLPVPDGRSSDVRNDAKSVWSRLDGVKSTKDKGRGGKSMEYRHRDYEKRSGRQYGYEKYSSDRSSNQSHSHFGRRRSRSRSPLRRSGLQRVSRSPGRHNSARIPKRKYSSRYRSKPSQRTGRPNLSRSPGPPNLSQSSGRRYTSRSPGRPNLSQSPRRPSRSWSPERPNLSRFPGPPDLSRSPERPNLSRSPRRPDLSQSPGRPNFSPVYSTDPYRDSKSPTRYITSRSSSRDTHSQPKYSNTAVQNEPPSFFTPQDILTQCYLSSGLPKSPFRETFPECSASPVPFADSRSPAFSQSPERDQLAFSDTDDPPDYESNLLSAVQLPEREDGEMSSSDSFEDAIDNTEHLPQKSTCNVQPAPFKTLFTLRSERRLLLEAQEERQKKEQADKNEQEIENTSQKNDPMAVKENLLGEVDNSHSKDNSSSVQKIQVPHELQTGKELKITEETNVVIPQAPPGFVLTFSPFKRCYELIALSPVKKCASLLQYHLSKKIETEKPVGLPQDTVDVLSTILPPESLIAMSSGSVGKETVCPEVKVNFVADLPSKPLSRFDLLSSSPKKIETQSLLPDIETPKPKDICELEENKKDLPKLGFDLGKYKIPKKTKAQTSSVNQKTAKISPKNIEKKSPTVPKNSTVPKQAVKTEVPQNNEKTEKERKLTSETKTISGQTRKSTVDKHHWKWVDRPSKAKEKPKYDRKKLEKLGLLSPEKTASLPSEKITPIEPKNSKSDLTNCDTVVSTTKNKRKGDESMSHHSKPKISKITDFDRSGPSEKGGKPCLSTKSGDGSGDLNKETSENSIKRTDSVRNRKTSTGNELKVVKKTPSSKEKSSVKRSKSLSTAVETQSPVKEKLLEDDFYHPTVSDVDQQLYRLLDMVEDNHELPDGLSVTAKISQTMDKVVNSLENSQEDQRLSSNQVPNNLESSHELAIDQATKSRDMVHLAMDQATKSRDIVHLAMDQSARICQATALAKNVESSPEQAMLSPPQQVMDQVECSLQILKESSNHVNLIRQSPRHRAKDRHNSPKKRVTDQTAQKPIKYEKVNNLEMVQNTQKTMDQVLATLESPQKSVMDYALQCQINLSRGLVLPLETDSSSPQEPSNTKLTPSESDSLLPQSSSPQDNSTPGVSSSSIENFEMFKTLGKKDSVSEEELVDDLYLSDDDDSCSSHESDYESDASALVNRLF